MKLLHVYSINKLRSMWIYFVKMSYVLAYCSVAVCIHIMPIFLYLKQCATISKIRSTVSCGLARQTRLMESKLKPLLNVLAYWTV